MFGHVFIIIQLNSKKRIFPDNFTDEVKRFRSTVASLIVACSDNKDICFPSPCILRTNCGQSEIKHVLASELKLLSPYYKRIGSCF